MNVFHSLSLTFLSLNPKKRGEGGTWLGLIGIDRTRRAGGIKGEGGGDRARRTGKTGAKRLVGVRSRPAFH